MAPAIRAMLLAGLAAGTLDILYAITVFGPLTYDVPAIRILQSVASGWIGRDAARAGEWGAALLGLGSHFAIMMVMAAVFVMAAAAKMRTLSARPLLSGVVYGLLLYVAMNYVVVPLSAAGESGYFAASLGEATDRLRVAFSEIRPSDENFWWIAPGAVFAHTVLVGVPIALINARLNPPQHA